MENPTLRSNCFEYTFLPNGDWIYKAIPFKKVTKEQPMFSICLEIEHSYQKKYDRMIKDSVIQITKFLLK